MNFYTIRILFILLFYLISYYLLKKYNINLKNRKLFTVALFILCIIIFNVMPENYFLKFNKISDAFNYSFPTKKVIFETKMDNYGFVVYKDNNLNDVICFSKEDDKWLFSSPITKYKNKFFDDYLVTIKRIEDTKSYFIYIDSGRTGDLDSEVIDLFDNSYLEFKSNNRYGYYNFIENMPDDYFVKINGKVLYIN